MNKICTKYQSSSLFDYISEFRWLIKTRVVGRNERVIVEEEEEGEEV